MRNRRDVQFALDNHLTVTIDRTAELLDVGRSTVYELLRAGKLSIRDLIAHPDNET